ATPDSEVRHYDKRHLFRYADEHKRYASGRDRLVVEWKGWKICPLVCYDLRFPVFSRNRHDSRHGFEYDLVLFVANWPSARAHAWRTLLRARAIENLSYCVGVNRVGVDGNRLPYSGDSAVLDYLGQAMADLGAQEQTVTVTLDCAVLAAFREKFPAWMDADAFELKS
ncbi:MAG: amidohydrolase, partial [Rhodanobacteraceae bacterium]